jgi:mannose/fructose/N-acetylgalactosamine-specific phosphotransferase system component IID
MAEQKLTRRDLWGIWWRSFLLQISWNFERMQAMGYCYIMLPILQKMYPSKEELAARLQANLEFFNTNPDSAPVIFGITAAMEEARHPAETVNSMKVGLMGPVASLGDTLLYTVPRTLVVGIAVAMALKGNFLSLPLWVLLYMGIKPVVRWFLLKWGYENGTKALGDIMDTGVIANISEGAAALAMVMVGALVATLVSINVVWTIPSGQETLKVQETLDSIVPKLIPAAATMLLFWAVRKRISTTWLILAVFVLALVGVVLGLFG